MTKYLSAAAFVVKRITKEKKKERKRIVRFAMKIHAQYDKLLNLDGCCC